MLVRLRYVGSVPIALTGEPIWPPGGEREIPAEMARTLLQRPDFVQIDPPPRRRGGSR